MRGKALLIDMLSLVSFPVSAVWKTPSHGGVEHWPQNMLHEWGTLSMHEAIYEDLLNGQKTCKGHRPVTDRSV